jgi:predicted  nucleic acid-binding Zn-ribbon protein
MVMSVEFSNTYQEILLDNLVSIIKQNFIFQTQLKLAEGGNKDKAELQEKYDTLFSQYESLKSQTPELEALRLRVDTNAGAHEEKSRIQSALNDEMRRSVELKGQLEVKSFELAGKTQEIVDLKNQILKLESSIPTSKLKKSNSVFDPIESTPLTPSSSKGKDGSTF